MTNELFWTFMIGPLGGVAIAAICVYLFTGENQRF
jgi:hypothetical protein